MQKQLQELQLQFEYTNVSVLVSILAKQCDNICTTPQVVLESAQRMLSRHGSMG